MLQKCVPYLPFSAICLFCLVSFHSISQIKGRVFKDNNSNGLYEQFEQGLPEVRVKLVNHQNEIISTNYTDSKGNFYFSVPNGEAFRLEFDNAPPSYFSTKVTDQNGGPVQYVISPSNQIYYGINNPDFFSGGNPRFMVPLLGLGKGSNTNSGLNSKSELMIIGADSIHYLKTYSDIGSVWGVAYDRTHKKIYSAAFAKRFVNYGELGPSGIYISSIDGNTKPFLKLEDFGFSAGKNSHIGLSDGSKQRSTDSTLFKEIGKVGLGGIDIDQNGENLFVMNLYDRSLYNIKLGGNGINDVSDIQSFSFPINVCSGGNIRPFAVKIHQNRIYVGSVCDAGHSKRKDDLSAIVWELNIKKNRFEKVITVPLTYERKGTIGNYEANRWYPWTDNQEDVISQIAPELFVHPQPILSKIEFDNEGAMILAFMDRMGHQHADNQMDPKGKLLNTSILTSGDILRLEKRPNGSYRFDKNDQGANVHSNGISNQGKSNNGEFYTDDKWEWKGQMVQSETGEGSIAVSPIDNQVVYTIHQPKNNVNYAHGLKWFSNQDGTLKRTTTIWQFEGSALAQPSLVNANALGDIELIDEAAPFGLGGRAWNDQNKNGIQDANEPAIPDLKVFLYDGKELLAVTTTQANGVFTFLNTEIKKELKLNANYRVVVSPNQNGAHYLPTVTNQGSNNLLDNDCFFKENSIEAGVNTSGIGYINYSTGIGLICSSQPENIGWKTRILNGIAYLIPDKLEEGWRYEVSFNSTDKRDYSTAVPLNNNGIVLETFEKEAFTIRILSAGGCYSDYTFYALEKNASERGGEKPLTLSPNPTEDELTFQFRSLPDDKPFTLTITDLLGRVIWLQVITPRNGSIIGSCSVKRLLSAEYLFQATDGQRFYTSKFSKK